MNMKRLAKKATHHAKKHKYKIILGAPIIFVLFVNIDISETSRNTISITSRGTPYVAVGDTFSANISINSPDAINSIGGNLIVPENTLEIIEVSLNDSLVDLWAVEPKITEGSNTILFGGGIIREDGFVGAGNIFTVKMQAIAAGDTTISLKNPEMLAHDGTGTNLLTQKTDLSYHVRKKGTPSPDFNGDNKITLMDINILYFNTLKKDDPRYDLNGDGKVTLGDVRILFSML